MHECVGQTGHLKNWNFTHRLGTLCDEKICKQILYNAYSSLDTAVCLHFELKMKFEPGDTIMLATEISNFEVSSLAHILMHHQLNIL